MRRLVLVSFSVLLGLLLLITIAYWPHQPSQSPGDVLEESVGILVAHETIPQWSLLQDPMIQGEHSLQVALQAPGSPLPPPPKTQFKIETVPKSKAPRNYVSLEDMQNVRGRFLMHSVRKGEVLTWSYLIPQYKESIEALLPGGTRAFTLAATPEAAAGGFALSGSRVDLILVTEQPDGTTQAQYLLENVIVRALDHCFMRNEDVCALKCRSVTLELTPEQTIFVAQAAQRGKLKLALRPIPDPKYPTQNPQELTGEVSRNGPMAEVLVSRADFFPFTPLRNPEKMFAVSKLPTRQIPNDAIVPTELPKLRNFGLRLDLKAGEVLTKSQFLEVEQVSMDCVMTPGTRCFAIKASPEVAGYVLPGSHVDILVVRKSGDQPQYLLQNILVRGVDQMSVRRHPMRGYRFETLTLEVSREDVLKLAEIADADTIRITIRPFGDR